MSSPAHKSLALTVAEALQAAVSLDLPAIQARLEASGGGVYVAHAAAALEIRVEVLNAPGPGAMRRERVDSCTSRSTGTASSGWRTAIR